MIEIKRWTDGKVIYTAENAQDVRAAVIEAVGEGANLHFADLRYANLRYANLRYANLHSADLRSADLRYADLRYANLHFADLRYANLHFANLHSADLRSADLRYADLHSANLHSADLRSADLRFADLHSANLHSANLHFANLHSADLRSADLHSADLHSADLRSAKALNLNRVNDLRILLDQPGKIRAYKVVTKDGFGPFNGGIKYEVGQTYEAKADTDEANDCGPGINLATLPWCLANFRPGYRVLLCEFTKKDIAAIPNGDGKFRCHKIKVVKELKLADLGIDSDGCDLETES